MGRVLIFAKEGRSLIRKDIRIPQPCTTGQERIPSGVAVAVSGNDLMLYATLLSNHSSESRHVKCLLRLPITDAMGRHVLNALRS